MNNNLCNKRSFMFWFDRYYPLENLFLWQFTSKCVKELQKILHKYMFLAIWWHLCSHEMTGVCVLKSENCDSCSITGINCHGWYFCLNIVFWYCLSQLDPEVESDNSSVATFITIRNYSCECCFICTKHNVNSNICLLMIHCFLWETFHNMNDCSISMENSDWSKKICEVWESSVQRNPLRR